jgi:chromosome segregation protein
MHLKLLELTGFKSFPEAKVEFPSGITAVVGPNGTGKSNVVDAVLWVLGEQSTKTLRSDRMEDVIFNGTQVRKPLGMAEVSLVMSGVTEGGFSDVMITRRLYRNGDSEYLINKTACRLKDIRSLLLDTRAGIKGHSVIEQGRLQQILDASPQDRRALIEETAGIVRYKKQKAEAIRKLEATEQNLVRVRDIIGEVRKQLNSLERQARQAKSYQNLQQETRNLEIRLWAMDYRQLQQERSAVEAELGELALQEAVLTKEEGAASVRLEEAKLRLRAGETSIGQLREQVSRLERSKAEALTAVEVQRKSQALLGQQRTQAEADIRQLVEFRDQHQADLEAKQGALVQARTELGQDETALAELEEHGRTLAQRRAAAMEQEDQGRRAIVDLAVQVAGARNALTELDRRRQEAGQRTERNAREVQALERQLRQEQEECARVARRRDELEAQRKIRQDEEASLRLQMQESSEQLREVERTISRKQQELAGMTSRLRTLEGMFREETGYGRVGQEETTSLRRACAGLKTAVAEWLIVPPELERAVESVLGERLRGWLVDRPGEAKDAVRFIKEHGLGRGAFVPVTALDDQPSGERRSATWWASVQGQEGVLGRAIDLLHAHGEFTHALTCLFDGVVIVESLEHALHLWEVRPAPKEFGPTFVTVDGDILEPSGIVIGGVLNPEHGILQRRREIEQLEERLAVSTSFLKEQEANHAELVGKEATLKSALDNLMDLMKEDEGLHLAASTEEAALKQSMEHLAHRIEVVQAEQAMAEEEERNVENEIRVSRDALDRVLAAQQAQEISHGQIVRSRESLEEAVQQWQQQSAELRVAVERLRTTLHNEEDHIARVLHQLKEADGRIVSLRQHISSLEQQLQESQAEHDRNLAVFERMAVEAGRVQDAMIAAQEAHAAEVAHAQDIEEELARARHALVAARSSRMTVEIKRAEIATRMEAVEGTLTGTYQLSVEEALLRESRTPAGEAAEGDETQSLRTELQRLRERIERMGPINLAAIDEHRELEERYRFLTSQEADLTESIRSLKEIIARINRTTKEMFMETFTQLQEKFNDVFGRFFRGGRAELLLTEPEEADQATSEHQGDSTREPGVEIVAQPPGKRLKSIAMLSGGEKTLTAMALIFASFLIKPTPFCILDEIDAPLDEENIGRFTAVLKELAERAQFIVITHNKRTMAVADSLFGVTMEEPGVSKVISVRLADLQFA